jgi:Tfp pilus assembly protein PilF
MRLYSFLALLALGGVGFVSAQSGERGSADEVQTYERRAHELLNQKQPDLAEKEFARVVAIDPRDLDARGNLGVLLYFKGDYAGAEPHLRAAFELQPDLLKIRALLGMCERHLGKMELARGDLEAAVPNLSETNVQVEAGLELVEIYSATQELDRAAGVLAILRKSAPTDARVLYAAYRIHSDLAGESLLDISLVAPKSGQMHQAMAHELYRQGDLTGAIENFREALTADPHLPGIQFELAEALYNSPEPKLKSEAEAEYRAAIAANKSDDKALCRLADVVAEKGNLDEAQRYYKQVLELAPNNTDAEVGLAFVYMQKEDPTAALPLLQRAVAADPTNIMAHYRLSTVYRRLGRPEDAKQELADYKKYKELKEKLRMAYKDLRSDTKVAEPDK